MALLLWLQFAYAVWQFVREAKFFRIPSAFIYHTYKWLTNPKIFCPGGAASASGVVERAGDGGSDCDQQAVPAPFSPVKLALVVQGTKWPYLIPLQNQLDPSDIRIGPSHVIQCRKGTKYLVHYESVRYEFMLRNRGFQFLCSRVDHLLPEICIADVYEWGEGFDHFMAEGASQETFNVKSVLLMSSREHFLNKDFTRLISIVPLMLQAKDYGTASIYVSLAILVLDQLSSPVNRLWNAVQDLLVGWTRLCISRIQSYNRRNAVALFLSTISPRLKFCDEVVRNFYRVNSGEEVLLFGTSCLDHFYEGLSEVEEPSELNPFRSLSADEFTALQSGTAARFGFATGTLFIEHRIAEASIKTFFIGEGYYNFIDNKKLHSGRCMNESQQYRIRVSLKWIEQNGRMPVTCNHRGDLRAVRFNTCVDKVAQGYGVVRGQVKKRSWVQ